MVDFNNESTVSTPASDIVRVLILESRYNVMEIIERYYLNKALGVDTDTDVGVLKARLHRFYYEISEGLTRLYTKDELDVIENNIDGNEFDTLLKAFRTLNFALDKWKLTRIDTKNVYDPTKVEIENKEKNL